MVKISRFYCRKRGLGPRCIYAACLQLKINKSLEAPHLCIYCKDAVEDALFHYTGFSLEGYPL